MKILDSKIIDFINKGLFLIQSKTDKIRNNSFLLLNIDWFILLSIILVYIFSIFVQNDFTAIFALLSVALIVFKVLITKGEKIELESSNFYLIIYLFICLITCFTSSLPVQSFLGFSKTLLYFAFYLALCQFLKNGKKYIIWLLTSIAVLITIESVIGLIQNTLGIANIATWQDTSYVNPENVLTRVYGTLKPYNPNLFGGWLIAGSSSLICLSAFFLYKKRPILAVCAVMSFLISALCIFFTGCRGAYIALFAIILCLIVVLTQMNKLCKMLAAGVTILGCSVMLLHQGILHRLMSIFILRGDTSTSFRMNVYNSSIQMFHDNPIWGIGVGNKVFREIYGLYMLSGFDALSSYCVFLEMAVESGIFALLAFLMFLGTLIYSSIKKFINSKDITDKILIFTAFTSILAVMIHGLFDTIYFRPQIQFIFWTMAGILTVICSQKERNNGIYV